MLYHLFEAQEAWLARLRPAARQAAGLLRGSPSRPPLRHAAALLELAESLGTTHRKPEFGLDRVRVGGAAVAVRQEVVRAAPFGRLLRFAKEGVAPGPRLLVVAPLSGHFATRLRDTVAALLPAHDVHVTDWTDARCVPLAAGPFGLDALVAQLIDWLGALGPGTHLLAVSQPAVAVLAATALMAEARHPARPRSLTLIGGPIDPRIDPTPEAALARALPISWFEAAEVATVPAPHAGMGRRVRPGAQQMAASVLADLPLHLAAQLAQWQNLALGQAGAAAAHRRRYDELLSVMDVPAELYLDTIRRVFQTAELAEGRMRWDGRPVRPEAIRDTALLVIEGERDASCPPGQGSVALALCRGLPATLRHHHLQPGAGHDTLFEGAAWRREICPLVAAMIRRRG
ncbi:polyhydroxyalkanoate depolymerase [Roseicella frigidaeris]|uniref:Polyhydroxyalkanoate depolymerase n=1 Tax=Roseicella frigidaeris TaxID=2230885 RepID=A0A327M5I9_9PROT|nr:polyhydroxyalkanoate depolymerase [Roseicella frigidaeris]RAI57636.1 polyhydroxyalkanoate depolymerase [Roseicella frigidaeris]